MHDGALTREESADLCDHPVPRVGAVGVVDEHPDDDATLECKVHKEEQDGERCVVLHDMFLLLLHVDVAACLLRAESARLEPRVLEHGVVQVLCRVIGRHVHQCPGQAGPDDH